MSEEGEKGWGGREERMGEWEVKNDWEMGTLGRAAEWERDARVLDV